MLGYGQRLERKGKRERGEIRGKEEAKKGIIYLLVSGVKMVA